jgi:uncharacterized small protein (DUF1192 family)
VQSELAERVAALTSDNERLKHLVGIGVSTEHKLRIQIAELQAEIERLRELKTPASRGLLNITKALLDDANAENAKLLADRDRILAELVSIRNYANGVINVTNRTLDARDDFSPENDPFNAGGTLKARRS